MEHLYKSCRDLPIANFDIIYKTNNFKYLIVGYDGYNEDIKIPKGANERWEEVKKEWIKAIDDNTIAYYYQLLSECVYLQTRYDVVSKLLDIILERDLNAETMEVYIIALSEWKYRWNRKAGKYVELKRMLQQLKGSKNKINIKMDELEDMKKESESHEEDSSLERQALIIEQGTKIKINIWKDSVLKWVEATKILSEINEQKK